MPSGSGDAPRSVVGFQYDGDADGFADAVVREFRAGVAAPPVYDRLHIYPGGSAGISADRQIVIENAGQPSIGGDINGDGYGDLVVPLTTGRGLAVYAGGPAGAASVPLSVSPGSFTPVLALGDFNGDGYGDIVADRGGNTIAIFLGSPTGLPTLPAADVTLPGDFISSGSVVTTGDLNGDGHGDIVLVRFDAGAQTSQIGIAPGGPGSVLEAGEPSYFPVASFPRRGTTADVDGDGIADLLTVLNGTVNVFFGSQAGLGSTPSQTLTFFPPGDSQIHNLVGGDFNGDGAADVAATIGVSGPVLFFEDDRVEIHLGGPQGVRLPAAQTLVETSYFPDNHNRFGANAVAAGDLDGDGRADLLVGAPTVFPPPPPDGFPLGPSSAFVFPGTATAVSPTPAPRLEGEPGFGTGTALSTPGISIPGL